MTRIVRHVLNARSNQSAARSHAGRAGAPEVYLSSTNPAQRLADMGKGNRAIRKTGGQRHRRCCAPDDWRGEQRSVQEMVQGYNRKRLRLQRSATKMEHRVSFMKSNLAGHLIRLALFALIFTACLLLSFYVLPLP